MTQSMKVFLAGASRGVGRELAQKLVAADHQVVALLRSDQAEAALMAMGITVVKGDALEAAKMVQLIAEHSPDAVMSTIGGLPEDGTVRADFVGNQNLIDAAIAANAKRFILISSIGSGNSAQALPDNVLEVLGPVLKEKAQAEAHLVNSGLVYTIIRPGGLVSESATGQEVLTEDPTVAGSIPRAAVAALAVRCLGSDRAHNKIFSAIDLPKQRSEQKFEVVNL
ncbi:MAG: NADH(P)-binding [Phormidesmis priestleyi Ana]|uniref:NADH(P)-binding n=1 Tax=Phormidesmis priestleyi Ana TaxID=1666911 RepID=A0A0P7Z0C3_9CYAN|nr:MAG: NADH(P)-binding [Phormidesmis priestleyi Ana]